MLKLPGLIKLEDYSGNWEKYLEVLYDCFKKDFVKKKTFYDNECIRFKKHPELNGKEATFWHLISEGGSEEQKVPDLRRCERIKWPKPIIEYKDYQEIKLWENNRKSDINICLCFGDWEYLVVLRRRKGYILLWTAYPISYNHTKRKLQKEYRKYWQNTNTAS